jgi:sugar phosphate isomerase/epimerase
MLPKMLDMIEQLQVEYVELNEVEYLFVHGLLNKSILRELKNIASSYPCHFSVHAPYALDLRQDKQADVQLQLFKSMIDLTHLINEGKRLNNYQEFAYGLCVVHYLKKSNEYHIEKKYESRLLQMADYAAQAGVLIAIENNYNERNSPLADMLTRLDHPNLKMTMDFGHAFLAAEYFGENFLDNIKLSLPYIRHIHLHDNFGIVESEINSGQKRHSLMTRTQLGVGDLHLPVGLGKIPWKQISNIVRKDYKGVYMIENNIMSLNPSLLLEIKERVTELFSI